MSPARRGMVAAWVITIATLGLADWLLDRRHDGSTLSETTRFVFQTHTPAGNCAFTLTWVALATWFWNHIARHNPTRGGTP